MSASHPETDAIAERVRAALDSGDLTAYAELLDPDVRWGAPDDPNRGCQNRGQVLAWYERGQQAGVRARVTEVVAHDDKILVGLTATGRAAEPGDAADRWQVLTVANGRVVDIRAFDDRADAAARVHTSA